VHPDFLTRLAPRNISILVISPLLPSYSFIFILINAFLSRLHLIRGDGLIGIRHGRRWTDRSE
jgi:hypothetical protein